MKRQQQVLRIYKDYHTSPPSLFRLIGRNLGRYFLMFIVFFLGAVLFISLHLLNNVYLLVGLLIGALLRDIAVFINYSRNWPIVESVLDWDHIDSLLEDKLDN